MEGSSLKAQPLTRVLSSPLLARDDDETFSLSPEQEAELLIAIAGAERGEVIPADQLLKNLRHTTCASGSHLLKGFAPLN